MTLDHKHASNLTLALRLERQRLRHREQRIAAVLTALRADELSTGPRQQAPRQLGSAIRDFQGSLAAVRRRLGEIDRAR